MSQKLITKIEKIINETSEYLSSLPTTGSTECAMAYVEFRRLDDAVDTLNKMLGHFKQEYKTSVLPKAFNSDAVKTVTLENGSRITVADTMKASIVPDRRDEAFQWLQDNDLGDLITETVNAASLSATARHLLEEGRELDQDLFKVVMFPQVSLTNPK